MIALGACVMIGRYREYSARSAVSWKNGDRLKKWITSEVALGRGRWLLPVVYILARDSNPLVSSEAISVASAYPEGMLIVERALKSPVPMTRGNAMRIMGYRKQQAAVPVLLEGLKDENGMVRVYAALALAELGNVAGRPVALAEIGNSHYHVRSMAVDALAAYADPADRSVLEKISKEDERFTVKHRAVLGLLSIQVGQLPASDRLAFLAKIAMNERNWVCQWADKLLLKDYGAEGLAAVTDAAQRSVSCAIDAKRLLMSRAMHEQRFGVTTD